MFRSAALRLCLIVAASGLLISAVSADGQSTDRRGRKYKAPPDTARIEVTVLREVNGKPIENAAVVFHSIEEGKGNMELKTNEDGKTVIDVLPMGQTVRMQIIAKGFQTFGDDYKIDQPKMAIEIRMRRPGEQYSIYKKHGEGQAGGKPAPEPPVVKDGASAPDGDKKPDGGAKDGSQSGQAQPK